MKYLHFLCLVFLLSSCGGGGGGGSSTPIPPQSSSTGQISSTSTTSTTATSSYNPNLPTSGSINLTGNFEADKATYEGSIEYQQQHGLEMINASSAYARGATGRGTIIGIMDSGVDTSHQELDGDNKLLSESYLVYQSRSPTTDEKRHGSHVAGIALGERDGSGIHGVAFDAQLFFISIELGTAGDTYEPATIDSSVDYTGIDNSWSQLEAEFINKNVTVVNGSFGYQGNINDYTEENIRASFPKTLAVFAQENKPDEDKTIFVWAAGNGGGYADQGVDYSSPEVFGGLAYLIEELRGITAAVVSIDQDGSISSFSNRCGVAKDYCLAAPGRSILSVYAEDSPTTDSYGRGSGTSMAAPHVSGGIALLADYFDGQLGNTEILERLFATANKSGIYANSEIYGQGLLDLDAATKPSGTTMIATIGTTLSDLNTEELGSFISISGPVFGNSIFERLGNLSYVVFDELGAPFPRKLSERILNNIPNIDWITSFQSNPNGRVIQRRSITDFGGLIKLGINHYPLSSESSVNLWANKEKKLAYFAFEQEFAVNSHFFFGKGTSPNTYLSSKKGISYKGNPFLEYSSNGSYFGFDKEVSSGKSLLFSYFKGSHRDEDRFIQNQNKNSGLILQLFDSDGPNQISYQLGISNSNDMLLGLSSYGGFGDPQDSKTLFLGVETKSNLKDFDFTSSLHFGRTYADTSQLGLIDDINSSVYSSFDISLAKKKVLNDKDYLSLEVSQPLKLEKAQMKFNLPVARTKDRKIIFNEYLVDLTPNGRQINAQIVYATKNDQLNVFGKVGLVNNEFHLKENKLEPYFLVDFEYYLK
mgnify:FL=1